MICWLKRRTCYQLGTRFAEPVRGTSPANHPPIWSKWSEWSMPPGVTRSECIPSLRCLLFCHAGPEKSSTLIYRCRPTMQTLLECFVRINLYFSTLINAYNKTVSTLCEFDRPMSNIGLLPNFVHVYFQAESATNLVISSYRCTAMVPWPGCEVRGWLDLVQKLSSWGAGGRELSF